MSETLLNSLADHAKNSPKSLAYLLLDAHGDEEARITYEELYTKIKLLGNYLHSQIDSASNPRALLLYPTSIDYMVALFACFYAGVIAVPVYPPRRSRHQKRLELITEDAKAGLILTNSSESNEIYEAFQQYALSKSIKWVETDQIIDEQSKGYIEVTQMKSIDPSEIAMLQYTSGSTGNPKGVMLSHSNLLYNIQMTRKALERDKCSETIVTWVPLYHDLGLIFHALQSAYVGCQNIMIPSMYVIQRPHIWLKAISDYKATISGGPNFIYHLCTEKVSTEHAQTFDLSSWSVALNGAEPVSPHTIDTFFNRFKDCHFKLDSFVPGYGLAEATVFVTTKKALSRTNTVKVDTESLGKGIVSFTSDSHCQKELVSCGTPWLDSEICIVNPETKIVCADNAVGEIWIKGSHVAKGYWNNPKATKETFCAYRENNTLDYYLKTGDLGFLYGGELYFCGRLKDIMVIRGHNYYPQDVESTVEKSHSGIVLSATIAFTIDDEHEPLLVVVSELSRQYRFYNLENFLHEQKTIRDKIKKALIEDYDLLVHDIVFIKQGTIDRTSSGKVQRNNCKLAYLKKELQLV